jgi:hypothetical protein
VFRVTRGAGQTTTLGINPWVCPLWYFPFIFLLFGLGNCYPLARKRFLVSTIHWLVGLMLAPWQVFSTFVYILLRGKAMCLRFLACEPSVSKSQGICGIPYVPYGSVWLLAVTLTTRTSPARVVGLNRAPVALVALTPLVSALLLPVTMLALTCASRIMIKSLLQVNNLTVRWCCRVSAAIFGPQPNV